ncbi:aromatic ring-hydroxylating dioxygenase subunit alpha [Marinicella sp. S1101]|uniref:aromatic ring-hydroxylating oxygenase subunit alpha n=1 Tax=Marinicella marina TaxID=2996016 RepID=UPI002260B86C|nr:aromatic ring-hydroxylating dioxygenase subunit alpha [Marinicella marina]MCX7553042.1 aromatic ring-hydroxylating dioxygenase subunit alpha [Marinicella marina]MDJ1139598.1 aromatic ring-hydroxylating dioxygenase subunit alpha [Marinicella marina]
MNPQDRQKIAQVAQSEPQHLAHSLPAEFYQAGLFTALDQTHVLHRSWQLAAHVSQLTQVGDYVVHQLGDLPIIVVNTGQGLKAFHNVCRHRAGPLAFENGHGKTLMCKYHGWNYHLTGELKSAPEMHTTPGFEVSDYQLPEVKLQSWQGMVFVALHDDVPELDAVVDGISQRIEPIDLNAMRFHRRDEFILDCNWKVYIENFLEGYHLPHVHPGLNQLLDYKSYQTELSKWYSYQFSPLDAGSGFYGEGQAHYYFIYPNTMLNILPNRLQTNQVLPLKHNQTKVIFDYYYPEFEDREALIEQDRVFSDEVQDEDIMICEAVQKGLDSGSYDKGRLCMKRETGLYHYQELIRAAYRRYTDQS